MFWDFHINNQESIHALMFLFGDRGLPSSVRHVNAYTGNTYKLTKADGTYHYARVHFLTNQGIEYLSNSEGAQLAGTQPDRHILDLQDAINSGNYPSWNLCVQTIHPSEISNASVDIFDMTKVWPHKQYPLRKVGRMVLDRNPSNWFAEIEQAAFSPSNMVRGIEPSPDPMLQARMFAYPDAARYRLGINYQFLPTNEAKSEVYCPTERDGKMNFTNNYGGDPNYNGTKIKPVNFVALDLKPAPGTGVNGKAVHTLDRADAGIPVSFASEVTDKDFEQATALWQVMGKQEGAQNRLVNNAAAHISGVKAKWIRDEAYGMISTPQCCANIQVDH
jgi:catalase